MAARAASAVSHRPKQVAPEPDIRASRHSACAASAARHLADHRLQRAWPRARRSLRCPASQPIRRGLGREHSAARSGIAGLSGSCQRREDRRASRTARRGLTSTAGQRRQRHRLDELADPAHPRRPRQQADRHVGPQHRRVAPAAAAPVSAAIARSTAAASAEPPPIPAAAGRRFSQPHRHRHAHQRRRAQDRIGVVRPAPPRLRARSTVSRSARPAPRSPVAQRRRRPPDCRAGDSHRPAGR